MRGARASRASVTGTSANARSRGPMPVVGVARVEVLRLDPGQVDAGRALRAAGLAADAGRQRLAEAGVVERDRARQRLAQQVGPAADGEALVARDAVGRAHRARAALQARADADAAGHLELERRARAQLGAEVLVQRRRVDDPARVEDRRPGRTPA